MNQKPWPNSFLPQLLPGQAVKVIGLGGIGLNVARGAAIFLASLKTEARLVFIDGDAFEQANATRMLFSRVGNKAEVVRDDLLPYLESSSLSLFAVPEFVSGGNLPRLIHDGDIVLMAVDNHQTRKLVSDYMAGDSATRKEGLRNACLISGGNDGVGTDASGKARRGTYGNVQLFLRIEGRDLHPPITRYHPEIAQPADKHPEEVSCVELIATQPQLLMTNLAVASAMLNTLWLHLCGQDRHSEISLDIAEGKMRPTLLSLDAL